MFPPEPLPSPYLLRVHSPIGRLELCADDMGITSLSIEHAGMLPRDTERDKPSRLLARAARQLDQYFCSRRRRFDLPLAPAGTAFQRSVWAALGELGWGEVTSYGDIGRLLGRPVAGRAVGGAVRANRIPIIVGCHRVLSSGGALTGYSQGEGIATKEWLLDHEGIIHATRAAALVLPAQHPGRPGAFAAASAGER